MYPKKKFYRSTRKRKIEEGRQMLLSLGKRNNVVNVTIDRRSLRHPRDTAGVPYTARIRMQMRRIGKSKWIV